MSSSKELTRTVPSPGPGLRRFAFFSAVLTLGLLGAGGLVTSHEAGMAVPDWPNTYGYNMFLFPVSKWMGGIFYEHTHRLLASLVGLMTAILAVWLWARETRGSRRWLGVGAMFAVLALMGVRQMPVYITLASLAPVVVAVSVVQIRREPQSLRWWGVMALAAVILQGVLGGLRVVWFKDQIGIFHATLAQLFFALMCAICLFTTAWWRREPVRLGDSAAGLRFLFLGAALLVLGQLMLGASMRHQHAGLAIPDFPLAYGSLWPAMDAQSVSQYNQLRREVMAVNPITAFQIGLQMAHRVMAALICVMIFFCAWKTRRVLGAGHLLARLSLAWAGMILLQALLGAGTIWSNKAADIATAHVLLGALSLAGGAMISCIAFHLTKPVPATDRAAAVAPELSNLSLAGGVK